MTLATRQGMMDEHIEVGRKYRSVKLNTTYSFGLDDQEFVVAFETDEPADFLDLVQDLRETEASLYTQRDVPLFTGIKMTLAEVLDALGGPKIARPQRTEEPGKVIWVEAGSLADLPVGESKTVFVEGQRVALFNVDGNLYALNDRCSHARGPLSEGTVEQDGDTCTVTCPWHYGKFDLLNGQVRDGVANAPVLAYDIDVRDGLIYVRSKP